MPDSKFVAPSPEEIGVLESYKTRDIDDLSPFASSLLDLIANGTPDEFVDFVERNREMLFPACANDPDLVTLLIMGYKKGIAARHANSANNLGALYYLGDLVDQDYKKAEQYYLLGSSWGSVQATINLGYIYEYGRIGKPDFEKAYFYYSYAASLTQNYEALYKMGDLIARGKLAVTEKGQAVQLWLKSFSVAQDVEEQSQAAIRLAPLYVSGDEESGVGADPLFALHLYQLAEVGLRMSIAKGYSYYEKRLDQAISGQATVRDILDHPLIN